MARINIEDKIWSDSRFKALAHRLGDEEKAVGRMIRAWRVAQEWWVKDQQLIPENIWAMNQLGDELFECMLARKTRDGIYVSGATEQFSWLIAKKKAGKLSGVSRRKKKKIEQDAISVRTQREQNAIKNEPLTLTPSLSPPLSQSLFSNTNTEKKEKTKTPAGSQATTTGNQELNRRIWLAYLEGYRQRYKTDPVRNATVNAQVVSLSRRLGEEAVEVVKFYLTHNKGFYVEKCHPIGLCLADAEALRTQWARGKTITRNDVRDFEQRDRTRSLLEQIDRGEL